MLSFLKVNKKENAFIFICLSFISTLETPRKNSCYSVQNIKCLVCSLKIVKTVLILICSNFCHGILDLSLEQYNIWYGLVRFTFNFLAISQISGHQCLYPYIYTHFIFLILLIAVLICKSAV